MDANLKCTALPAVAIILLMTVILSCAGRRTMQATTQPFPDSPFSPFNMVTLENGLDVIVKEVHTAPIVAVYLWCNTGSVNEEERVHGISHFYEHMFFKGTEKRGVGEIDRAIKSIGGYNNAFTYKEYTAYFVVLPSENFDLAADVLIDAIRNSSFQQEDIEKELGVIKEEINRKEDNPTGTLYEEIFKLMFPGTPYAHPVLGTKESVSQISREDFKDYLSRFYVPNNMTAVVIGDVDTDDAVKRIQKLTAGWEPNPDVDKHIVSFDVPKREGIQGVTLEKDVNMSYVMMAFRTSGLKNEEENIALDIASSILGEGRSSRLYRRLVEIEQIAASVQAFILPLNEAGMFTVFGTMDREKVPAFKKAVIEEVEKLRSTPPTTAELNKVKTMLKADYTFANETNADIGQTLGLYKTIDFFEHIVEYEKRIDGAAAADITRYVKNTLTPESYTIGVVNQRIPTDSEVRGE
ncbi:M16 family metallopeptidase [Candidatus Latescibacterota bacterium]